MAPCKEHPDREAKSICMKCGEPCCEKCVENSPGRAYCQSCMKSIAARTRNYRRGSVTLPIALGALLSAAIGLATLFAAVNAANVPQLGSGLGAISQLQAFAGSGDGQRFGFALASALLYLVLGLGIMANRRWAFYLGLLLNAVMFYAAFNPSEGYRQYSSYMLAALAVLSVAILAARRNLDI
ncbi:MAG: B-box zinc finger protein [Candidatus ainarchaeum sp.]|nr:B-box zinc finger protein [Candidatus ainarchaeum sp.]